jgi:hypothetical protein
MRCPRRTRQDGVRGREAADKTKTAAVGVRIFHISKVCPQLKETCFVKEARSCTDWVERDFFNTGGVKGRTEFSSTHLLDLRRATRRL